MNVLTGHISLDFRADEPLNLQIVRQIENLVKDGVLKPGDQLPTVRALAIDLRINFSTVARAYRILDEKKLISTQRGRGTYIWDEILDGNRPQLSDINQRSEKLVGITQIYLRAAIEAGASPEEIKFAFLQEIENWINNK